MENATMLDWQPLEDRHWWFRGRLHAVREVGRLLVPREGRVVQVGCGTGSIIGAFPSSFTRHGIDPSPGAIAAARRRYPDVTFEVGWAPEAGAAALAAADLVVVCDVLEHQYDDAGFMRALLGRMKSGAHLLVTLLWNAALAG
jgi:2-polyprenyl-3-methyl-5-hydroxy-6-metoxy-1,4-benzoquinol methylase